MDFIRTILLFFSVSALLVLDDLYLHCKSQVLDCLIHFKIAQSSSSNLVNVTINIVKWCSC